MMTRFLSSLRYISIFLLLSPFLGFSVSISEEKSSLSLPAELKGNLQKLRGNRFVRAKVKEADYYLLYFSASWCGPCRKSAPEMVKLYQDFVKNNPEVEIIMFNMDESEAPALTWAKSEKFPWPLILSPNEKVPKLFNRYAQRYIPYYVLVEKNGKVVAQGKEAIKKIKSF